MRGGSRPNSKFYKSFVQISNIWSLMVPNLVAGGRGKYLRVSIE